MEDNENCKLILVKVVKNLMYLNSFNGINQVININNRNSKSIFGSSDYKLKNSIIEL